jgi:hypothetical protein
VSSKTHSSGHACRKTPSNTSYTSQQTNKDRLRSYQPAALFVQVRMAHLQHKPTLLPRTHGWSNRLLQPNDSKAKTGLALMGAVQ